MILSIHIVTAGRRELLELCLKSVLPQLAANCEVIVIVNGNHPSTVEYLSKISEPNFRYYVVRPESLSASRNRGFHLARGEFLYFLDDDVILPRGNFIRVIDFFKYRSEASVVGGPNLTPPSSPFSEKAFGNVMTTWFAAPMIRKRYLNSEDDIVREASEHHLIFCNLALRKADFLGKLCFRENLSSNQENFFLFEAKEKNTHVYYDPALYVFHRRRKNMWGFAKQISSYGKGRYEQTIMDFKSSHPFFYLPAVFVIGLISSPFLMAGGIFPWAGVPIYFFLSLISSIQSRVVRQLGLRGILFNMILTFWVHCSYGVGFLLGLIHSIIPKRWSQTSDFDSTTQLS